MPLFRVRLILLGVFIYWLVGFGIFKPYRKTFFNHSPPDVILVLGGDVDREHTGANLARGLSLPLIVSGGSNPEHAEWLIQRVGISKQLVKLDYRAKDTFGNFTSLVDDLRMKGVDHVLLVTSQDHLWRAMSVGQIIFGSRGIRLTGISISCKAHCVYESWQKNMFDSMRAGFWVLTGNDLRIWIKDYLHYSFDY